MKRKKKLMFLLDLNSFELIFGHVDYCQLSCSFWHAQEIK